MLGNGTKEVDVESSDFPENGIGFPPFKVVGGMGGIDVGNTKAAVGEFGASDVIVLGYQQDRTPFLFAKESGSEDACVEGVDSFAVNVNHTSRYAMLHEVLFHYNGFIATFDSNSAADHNVRKPSFSIQLKSAVQPHTQALGRFAVGVDFVAINDGNIGVLDLIVETVNDDPGDMAHEPQTSDKKRVASIDPELLKEFA